MSKNIVICCDGTGNQYGDQNSNVVKLYSALVIDGATQVGYYHPGVGTMGAPGARNRISGAWSVLMGLAFGLGLLSNVSDAYRYLTRMSTRMATSFSCSDSAAALTPSGRSPACCTCSACSMPATKGSSPT